MSADPSPNHLPNLVNTIYNHSVGNRAEELSDFLSSLSPELVKEYLHCARLYHTHEGDYTAPLLAAVRCGSKQVVEVLLDYHSKHCESKGLKCMESSISALSQAGFNGNLDVVRVLLQWGADVNDVYEDGDTALHAVCNTKHIHITEYLLSHGARPDIGDVKGETCLFRACCRGQEKVVRLLLEKGADPNHASISKSTPLHAAAEGGNLAIVQMLLEKKALISKDENGLSPLTVAACTSSVECVEYFLTLPAFSRQERIDALELLGGNFVFSNEEDAYNYLKRAMEERYQDPENILLKPLRPPVPELGNVVESQTLEELQHRKQHDYDILAVESLLARERILGTDHIDVGRKYHYLVAYLCERGRLDDAVMVWKYVYKPFRWTKLQFLFNSLILEIFNRMTVLGSPPPFSDLLHALQVVVMEIEREASADTKEKDFVLNAKRSLMLFIRIILKALEQVKTNDDLLQLHGAASQLANGLSPFDEISVLHCAIDEARMHLAISRTEERRSSFISLIDFLVRCGADINPKDVNGDAPLHILAGNSFRRYDLPKFACSVTRILVEAGAHTDARNMSNRTPVDMAAIGGVRDILLQSKPLPLRCLTASVIIQCNVAFQGIVPSAVENFIRLHSSHQQ